jgi:Flp pilus assembly pilin Flp
MISKLNKMVIHKQAELATRDEGQTMVEYGLVLVAVALAALAAYSALGGRLVSFITNITF